MKINIKGVRLSKKGQNYQISVFCSKSVFRYRGITSQISRGLTALELFGIYKMEIPPKKMGGKEGGGFVFFFVFNRKRKIKWKKIFSRKSFRDSKTVFFFHSSIKTEEVLFFYIYLYIYKKLSPKLKNFHSQKVFLFLFHILCGNFSKIGLIIKKWGAKVFYRGSKFDFFQCLFSLFIYLFI